MIIKKYTCITDTLQEEEEDDGVMRRSKGELQFEDGWDTDQTEGVIRRKGDKSARRIDDYENI